MSNVVDAQMCQGSLKQTGGGLKKRTKASSAGKVEPEEEMPVGRKGKKQEKPCT